jgi:hypothetical protein
VRINKEIHKENKRMETLVAEDWATQKEHHQANTGLFHDNITAVANTMTLQYDEHNAKLANNRFTHPTSQTSLQ